MIEVEHSEDNSKREYNPSKYWDYSIFYRFIQQAKPESPNTRLHMLVQLSSVDKTRRKLLTSFENLTYLKCELMSASHGWTVFEMNFLYFITTHTILSLRMLITQVGNACALVKLYEHITDIPMFTGGPYGEFSNVCFSSETPGIVHLPCLPNYIEAGIDVNAVFPNGNTLLISLFKIGILVEIPYDLYHEFRVLNPELNDVRLLLDKGCNVNAIGLYDQTALNAAMNTHSIDLSILQTLCEYGVNTNHPDGDGNTALMVACMRNKAGAAKVLIDNGADVDLPGHDGTTPLMLASFYGNIQIAEYLIKAGANIHAKNAAGYTAFHIACLYDASALIHSTEIIATEYSCKVDWKKRRLPNFQVADNCKMIVSLLIAFGVDFEEPLPHRLLLEDAFSVDIKCHIGRIKRTLSSVNELQEKFAQLMLLGLQLESLSIKLAFPWLLVPCIHVVMRDSEPAKLKTLQGMINRWGFNPRWEDLFTVTPQDNNSNEFSMMLRDDNDELKPNILKRKMMLFSQKRAVEKVTKPSQQKKWLGYRAFT